MPMITNWRDYVTDDVALVFDLDSYCYMSASSHEQDVLTVVHKASGREVFKEKDVPETEKVCINPETQEQGYVGTERPRMVDRPTGRKINIRFKNKTDFQGRTKKVPSGWLGDLNTKREAEGKTTYTADDFELSYKKELTGELSWAINGLKAKIQRIKDYLGVDNALYLIGSGENHRHKLQLPMNPNKPKEPLRGQYKGNRDDGDRPILLEDVRDYAVQTLGALDVKGVEADDVLNFYAWKSHLNYKKTGKHTHILISMDKDSFMFNGMIFNYYVPPKSSAWKHPHPYIVDGMGFLDLKDGKLVGDGILFCMAMMLIGDSSDNWLPTRHSKISFGGSDAYALLNHLKTPQEAVQAVYDQYKAWYPEGTRYKSWEGKEMDLTAREWLDMMWAAAYMLKSREDDTTFTDVMDRLGLSYE